MELFKIMSIKKDILTAGVDIGSSACKCVILRNGTDVLAKNVIHLGTGTEAAKRIQDETLAICALTRHDIDFMIATGYGRMTFPNADKQISELSCHAKGVRFLLPETRTIIDIGGQDIKVICLGNDGRISSFLMNDKCAAGTGRFLEVMAKVLNVSIRDFERLSQQSKHEINISNTCTVFAESEVISHLASNIQIEDIINGLHISVAKRVAALAFRNDVTPPVAVSGGVALNHGLVKALGQELGIEIYTHSDCQMAGALGAALLAWDEVCS